MNLRLFSKKAEKLPRTSVYLSHPKGKPRNVRGFPPPFNNHPAQAVVADCILLLMRWRGARRRLSCYAKSRLVGVPSPAICICERNKVRLRGDEGNGGNEGARIKRAGTELTHRRRGKNRDACATDPRLTDTAQWNGPTLITSDRSTAF